MPASGPPTPSPAWVAMNSYYSSTPRTSANSEAALLRILDQLALPYDIAGHSPALSASIGVTLAPRPSDPDGLLRHADQAMYVAKQSGKNRYHLFDAHHERLVQARRSSSRESSPRSWRRNSCCITNPTWPTAKLPGPMTIRWQHLERGLLPDQFLPFIEDSDFIVTLGNWVIEQALAQMAQWHRCRTCCRSASIFPDN